MKCFINRVYHLKKILFNLYQFFKINVRTKTYTFTILLLNITLISKYNTLFQIKKTNPKKKENVFSPYNKQERNPQYPKTRYHQFEMPNLIDLINHANETFLNTHEIVSATFIKVKLNNGQSQCYFLLAFVCTKILEPSGVSFPGRGIEACKCSVGPVGVDHA